MNSTANTTNERVCRVFVTHNHVSGEKHIGKLRELLDECVKRASDCDRYELLIDTEVLKKGDDYSKLEDFYNKTDLNIVILSEGINVPKEGMPDYVNDEIRYMKGLGIPVLPVIFEGSDSDPWKYKPSSVDSKGLDMRDGRQPDEKDKDEIAGLLTVHDKTKRANAIKALKGKMEAEKAKEQGKEKGPIGTGAKTGAEKAVANITYVVIILLALGLLYLIFWAIGHPEWFDEFKEIVPGAIAGFLRTISFYIR